MIRLRVTLLSDGASDRALIPILKWLLKQHGVRGPMNLYWADLRGLPSPPTSLADRILKAIELFPCDALFIHRDAEVRPQRTRIKEIERSAASAQASNATASFPVLVPVVPVRMQEAWLLIDASALRRAVRNPNGRVSLEMPPVGTLESVADPKSVLYRLLEAASELHGRRLRSFRHGQFAARLAEEISTYSPLRSLSAFNQLESSVQQTVRERQWNQ